MTVDGSGAFGGAARAGAGGDAGTAGDALSVEGAMAAVGACSVDALLGVRRQRLNILSMSAVQRRGGYSDLQGACWSAVLAARESDSGVVRQLAIAALTQ